jgi:outer membrane receptor for Fe3+-dicitrate
MGREADHSSSYKAEFKNGCRCTLTTTIYLHDTQKDFTFISLFLIKHNNMEFDVLEVVITKNSTFWSVTPCSFVTNHMAKHPILK